MNRLQLVNTKTGEVQMDVAASLEGLHLMRRALGLRKGHREYTQSEAGSNSKRVQMYVTAARTGKWRTGRPYSKSDAINELVKLRGQPMSDEASLELELALHEAAAEAAVKSEATKNGAVKNGAAKNEP